MKEQLPTLKMRAYRATLISALALAAAAQSPQPVALAPPRSGFAFPQKETLTYSVDWRVFPVATATVHFEADGDRERLTTTAETSGAINMLFHLSDHLQTSFDRVKGCTYEFDKQTVEGRRQINSTLKLDYSQNKSILDEKNLVTGQAKHVETPVQGCLTDLLTGMFYTASQPLEVGHSFVVPVTDAQRTVPVTMKVEGLEEIKTTLGTYKTVRVQPTADAGVVKNRGNIWIWYTNDDRHLPVQMRARSFWGTITFRLTGDDNK